MGRRIASLLTVLMTTGCLSSTAFAQAQPWGVSEYAMEKRQVPGIGFLDPAQTLMCKAMVSPIDGTFATELIEQGDSLGFLVDNESDVPVSVIFETRDLSGELQGALVTRVGAESSRRLSLQFWTDMRSPVSMVTQVRVMPLKPTDDISVIVAQQKITECSAGPDAGGQVMDCSVNTCSLRGVDPDLQGGTGDEVEPGQGTGPHGPHGPDAGNPGEEMPGQGTGPHGPHLPDPGPSLPGAEMPGGLPGTDGTGPHGPHLSELPTGLEDVGVGESPMSQAPVDE